MANALLDGQVIGFNPMVADTPPQYAGPAKPAQSNWFLDALGRDANRLMGTVANGVSAPINALTGQYNYVQVDPTTGAVQPVNSGMMQAAGDMSSLINLGAPGMVPADALGMGIKAYHGTPHSFDKFDLSKIGTGEGAQVFGHGLYFAENPAVAKSYAGLAGLEPVTKDGTPLPLSDYGPDEFAARSIADSGGDIDEAITGIKEQLAGKWGAVHDPAFYQSALDVAQGWKASGVNVRPKGNAYEVEINAEPDEFLDWEKPLPPGSAVKLAYDKLRASHNGQEIDGIDAFNAIFPSDNPMQPRLLPDNPTGQEAYDALSRALGGQANASRLLSQAGVKGIRYLDQGSRGQGAGTSNYVLFSHEPVSITGKLPAAAGAPAGPVTHTPADPSHPVLTELRT